MKTKITFFRTLAFAFSLAMFLPGCEKAGMENADAKLRPDKDSKPVVTDGAGSGFTIPNVFDASGLVAKAYPDLNPQEIGKPMELWMGVGNEKAGTLVGHVSFLTDQSMVRIDLTDLNGDGKPDMFPFVITEVHIHFAADVDGIPHAKNGNPVPGQFEYNVKVDPGISTIDIPVEFDKVGAIHLSVVKYGGIDGFNFYLPNDQVTMRITDYPTAGDPSYFKVLITGAGFISDYDMGFGDGIYEGWCIDTDNTINLNQPYSAYLFSSYESLPGWLAGPDGQIEFPGNLDKINFLVNTFKTGDLVTLLNSDCTPYKPSGSEVMQALTFGDIQRAIWHYIDNNQSTSGLADWSQQRVNAITCFVDERGEGFVPSCAQKVIFLVVPIGTEKNKVQVVIGQPVIGEIQVPCETMSGTAWGDGKFGAGFPGAKQWGTYFLINLEE